MAATTDQAVRVDPSKLVDYGAATFESVGVPDDDARLGAELLVGNDIRGVHTHGLRCLPIYMPLLRGGAMRADATPEVIRETGGTAVVDGNDGLGVTVAAHATDIAIEKSKENGAGALVLVRNSNHFAANGAFALRCAEAGLIGFVTTNAVPVMAAPGARGRIVSNAPVAYAVPVSSGPPILFDVALSESAGSRIIMAMNRGTKVPEGVLVDADGVPTTDPSVFRAGGALTAIGGHKGYGLALFAEILSGVLSGAGVLDDVLHFPSHPNEPSKTGHTIAALNIAAFMDPAEFDERLRGLIDSIHGAPAAKDSDTGAMMPGELEAAHERDTEENGLELDAVSWQELLDTADEADTRESLEAALVR